MNRDHGIDYIRIFLTFLVIFHHTAIVYGRPIDTTRHSLVDLLFLIAIGVASFLVRIFIPVGKHFMWLQLGYFVPYLFLFIFAVHSYKLF
jgi:hypothetical protein